MDALSILLYPFIACVLLVLIHTYFGIHILQRGIIFVDLALAQFIGMGIAVSFLFHDGFMDAYGFSLTFALIGASILSFSKYIAKIVYIEAFIGVMYVFSLAFSILILDRTPHGLEEFKTILNGNIIWVTSKDVLYLSVLYGVIGIFHFIYRKKILSLSNEGNSNLLWEFLFFLSFALVLVSSVKIAGILQVFAYLILPALMGRLLAKKTGTVLILGWLIGLVATLSGITVSFFFDLPTSPVIISSLCIPFGILLIVRLIIYNRKTYEK
ncbi:MAG: metal ABC transporter permease [Nitrospirae bacterium]|nr:metal ABC transporter permease [Nitrospirota bacterium]